MYQLIAYIKFSFSATNHHGVHSPFVYNFVTKCLYDKTKYPAYTTLSNYRKSLNASKVTLEITDLGQGSRILNPKSRKVRDMVKTSSSSKKDAQLLFRVSRYFKFQSVLELGTSLGMGTYAFALADPSSNITTIEGCANTSDFAKSNLVEQITFIKGDFATTIPTLEQPTFDCIYFDGHHNKAATIQYFEALLSKVNNDTVFIFDDIYWSQGMTEAWAYVKAHKAVTVTVDTFHLGFVFFRKEQAKQHFKIRL